MAKFNLSAVSQKALQGVHPKLVSVVKRAIELTTQDFRVMEGLRSHEAQVENMAKGVSKTLNSKHLLQPDGFGHAVDLVPWINGQPRWEWLAIYPIASAMRQAAAELDVQLTWGGVWDRALLRLPETPSELKEAVADYQVRHHGSDFLDGPHYELGVPT